MFGKKRREAELRAFWDKLRAEFLNPDFTALEEAYGVRTPKFLEELYSFGERLLDCTKPLRLSFEEFPVDIQYFIGLKPAKIERSEPFFPDYYMFAAASDGYDVLCPMNDSTEIMFWEFNELEPSGITTSEFLFVLKQALNE